MAGIFAGDSVTDGRALSVRDVTPGVGVAGGGAGGMAAATWFGDATGTAGLVVVVGDAAGAFGDELSGAADSRGVARTGFGDTGTAGSATAGWLGVVAGGEFAALCASRSIV